MANSDGSDSHQLQLQASSLSVSYTQNSNGSILWSMLPDKWDCPHDNQYGIQSDGLYLRSLPQVTSSDAMWTFRANKCINVSHLIHAIGSVNSGNLTLAPPTLSHHQSSSSFATSNSNADFVDHVYYFEVFVVVSGFFSVGFDTNASSNSNSLGPGISPNSIGLDINGDLLASGIRFPNWTQETFQNGDTIGCGIVLGNNASYFFTKNGVQLGSSGLSSFQTPLFPTVSVSSSLETIIRTNFGCESDTTRFMWKGTANIRMINSINSLPAENDVLLPLPTLTRGHTIDCDTRDMNELIEKAETLWNNTTIERTHLPQPLVPRLSAVDAQNSQPNDETDDQRGGATSSNNLKGAAHLDLNDIKELARELRNATSASDAHHEALSSLIDVCQSNLEQLTTTIQRTTMGEDSEYDLGELLAVHELVADAIKAAEEKKSESNNNVKLHSEERVTALLCRLRSKQRQTAVWGLLRMVKKGRNNERSHEILSAGGMQSLLTLFKTSSHSAELMMVSALTVVYLLPALLESDVQSSSYIHFGVIQCLQFLTQSANSSNIDNIDISLSEVRTASVFAMTNLWFKVLVPKLQSSDMDQASGIMERYDPGDSDDPSFFARRRSSLSSQNVEEVDCCTMIDAFTRISIVAAVSETSRQDRNDMNAVLYEFALIVESVTAVEYARPMAMSEGVMQLLLKWLRSDDIDLERPAASALRNLTLTGDGYVAGWVHSNLLHEKALSLIIGELESDDYLVRLAMTEIISSLSVAPHTRAAIVQAQGVKYLVQLLGSVDIAHDEPLALAAGHALLRLAVGATVGSGGVAQASVYISTSQPSSKEDGIIDDIIENGALNTLVSMARSKRYGSLRFLSAKILRVISEGCSGHIKHDGREVHLCGAEAVSALGRILSIDITSIRSFVENSSTSSGTSDLINDSLSNDFLTSTMAGPSKVTIQEVRFVLRALVNILHTSPAEESDAFLDTQLIACAQLIASGGIKSMLWISSMSANDCAALTRIANETNCYDIKADSCQVLSLLCPLLLIQNKQFPGTANWTPFVSSALVGFLQGHTLANVPDNDVRGVMPDIMHTALQGLNSLAHYYPLRTRIIDEFLPQLLDLLVNRNVADAASQVMVSLGFVVDSETSDAYLLGDKFNLSRSRWIQGMLGDEIRQILKQIWVPAVTANSQLLRENSEHSYYTNNELGALYRFLAQDQDTLSERDKIRQQFLSVYDGHSKSSPSGGLLRSSSSFGRKQKVMKRAMFRRSSHMEGVSSEVEALDRLWDRTTSSSEGISINGVKGINEHILSDFVGNNGGSGISSTASENNNFLSCHQYPLNSTQSERDWVLSHCQDFGKFTDAAPSLFLPDRATDLLRIYFPSTLIRDQVIPLSGFSPDDSFSFRAFTMPSGTYYSFRREGVLLFQECQNLQHQDRSHNTLCFRNSSYAGEFAESLLQALYMCPVIQGVSFSNDNFDENHDDSQYSQYAYQGTESLPFLVRAIPSSVTCLTFDNVLSDSAVLSLAHILKSVYEGVDDEETVGSASISVKASFHSLAITNSPHIKKSIFSSLVESLDGQSSPLQFLRTLDLSGNFLGDDVSAKVLSIALSSSSMIIKRLDLSKNDIGEGVAVRTVLQECALNRPKLEVLNMSQNNLGRGKGELAFQIAASMNDVLSKLVSINLSGNMLSDGFLAILGYAACATNCTLVNFDVSYNQFSSSSINGFLSRLHNISQTSITSKLAFIYLKGNEPHLTPNQDMVLNEIVSNNRQRIVRMHLKENNGSDESDSNTKLSSISDITGEISDRKLPPAQVMTVLFSAPLVWRKDGEDELHPIEILNFKLERSLLWQVFSEASRNIDLSFDNATTDRLQAVITKGSKCLHFSGHGHPQSLTFEDGSGGIHWLSVDVLKALIAGGSENGEPPFEFVFVSACHSALAGQSFIDSGVPHVVCCQQESQLMDNTALSFTRAFYLSLALGRSLKDSFEIGKHAVLSSATVPNPNEEMQKFMLLPEDGDHDVPIFTAEQVSEWPLSQKGRGQNDYLPSLPQGFIGRETDLYKTLNLVIDRRFVNIVGSTGMGRSSLASVLCQYIDDRKSTLLFNDIYYVKLKRSILERSSPIISLHKQLVSAGKVQTLSEETIDLVEVIQAILTSLIKDRALRALLVFDGIESLDQTTEAQDLYFFLGEVLDQTKNVHVLVTSNNSIGLSPLVTVGESVHSLGPLNFRNTVKLFAFHCPHLHSSRERKELVEELSRSEDDDEVAGEIMSILGGGIPAKTFAIAYEMTPDGFQALKQIRMDSAAKAH